MTEHRKPVQTQDSLQSRLFQFEAFLFTQCFLLTLLTPVMRRSCIVSKQLWGPVAALQGLTNAENAVGFLLRDWGAFILLHVTTAESFAFMLSFENEFG